MKQGAEYIVVDVIEDVQPNADYISDANAKLLYKNLKSVMASSSITKPCPQESDFIATITAAIESKESDIKLC